MERNGEKDVTLLERGLKYEVLDWMHTAEPYRHFRSTSAKQVRLRSRAEQELLIRNS